MSNKALRVAYIAGVTDGHHGVSVGSAPYEALRLYPVKTRLQPREVEITFKNGDTARYRFINDRFEIKFPTGWDSSVSAKVFGDFISLDLGNFGPAAAASLLELRENPTETVEVDE